MEVIFAADFVMVVVAVGAGMVLSQAGFSSEEQTSGMAVRLD